MKNVVLLPSRGKKINVLMLIGSFLVFIGILGIFVSISDLYQDWYAMNHLTDCYNKATTMDEIKECRQSFYAETGIVLNKFNGFPTPAQNVITLFKPIMVVLWWIVLVLFGIFVYRLGYKAVFLELPLNNKITTNNQNKVKKKSRKSGRK